MKAFTPFADESGALTIGECTLENGADRVSLYGSLDLTRDRAGLAHARALKAALDAVVAALEAEADLPAKLAEAATGPREAPRVKNPFA